MKPPSNQSLERKSVLIYHGDHLDPIQLSSQSKTTQQCPPGLKSLCTHRLSNSSHHLPFYQRKPIILPVPCPTPYRSIMYQFALGGKYNPHYPIKTFFLEYSTSVVFQCSVFHLPKGLLPSSLLSQEFRIQTRFLWL